MELLNTELINTIQEELHEAFYASQITKLSKQTFKLEKPKIVIDNSPIETNLKTEDITFDILGYFNQETNDSIHLCPQKIIDSATRRGEDVEILTTIVYIHETAHYFHFHARKLFNASGFKDKKKMFSESFAQLLTHRVCQKLRSNPKLLNTFLDFTDKLPIEYKQYKIPYEKKIFLGLDKNGKEISEKEMINIVMQNFSASSIMNTFIIGPIKENIGEIINSIQTEAEKKILEGFEDYIKDLQKVGIVGYKPEFEDDKFID